MALYRKKGQIDVLEKVPQKPKNKIAWGEWFGAFFLIFIILAVIGGLSK